MGTGQAAPTINHPRQTRREGRTEEQCACIEKDQEEWQVKDSGKVVSLKVSQKHPMTVTVIPVLVDEEMRLKDILSLT